MNLQLERERSGKAIQEALEEERQITKEHMEEIKVRLHRVV